MPESAVALGTLDSKCSAEACRLLCAVAFTFPAMSGVRMIATTDATLLIA